MTHFGSRLRTRNKLTYRPVRIFGLKYTQTYYEVGRLPANGEPVVEVFDLEKPSSPNPTGLNPYNNKQ
jgi:hypothetical protein